MERERVVKSPLHSGRYSEASSYLALQKHHHPRTSYQQGQSFPVLILPALVNMRTHRHAVDRLMAVVAYPYGRQPMRKASPERL